MSGIPQLTTRIGHQPHTDTAPAHPPTEPSPPTNPATGFNAQPSQEASAPMPRRAPTAEPNTSPPPTHPANPTTGLAAPWPSSASGYAVRREPTRDPAGPPPNARPSNPGTDCTTQRPTDSSISVIHHVTSDPDNPPPDTRPTNPTTGLTAPWPSAPSGPTAHHEPTPQSADPPAGTRPVDSGGGFGVVRRLASSRVAGRRGGGADLRSGITPVDDGTWSADPYAYALRTGRGPLFLRRADGWLLLLEVERWCAEADGVDLEVLRRCEGAVLDVGCGPGRLVVALGERGLPVLGIDVSEAAVARTVALGGQALRRSVFEPLPAEGRWGTALLLDGNVGIGGDPRALLDRMAQLLAPGGLLIAETVPDPEVDERVRVHVTDARGAAGSPFPWARLGTPALLRHARHGGWRAVGQWTAGGRCFVALRSRGRNSTAATASRQPQK